jgi:hypothetical protein
LWQPPASMRQIVAVDGLDHLREDPGVHQVILRRGPGQHVDARAGNWEHVFAVFGAAADHEQLKLMARRVHTETRVRGE